MWKFILKNKLTSFLISIGTANAILTIVFLVFDGKFNLTGKIDSQLAADIGTYLAGTSGTLWGAAGLIVLMKTLHVQQDVLGQQKKSSEQQSFETYFLKNLDLFDNAIKEFTENGRDPIIKSATEEYLWENDCYDIELGYICDDGVDAIYETDLEENLQRSGERIEELRTKDIELTYNETFLTNHFYNILDSIKKNSEDANNYEQLVFAKLPKDVLRFLLYYTLFHQEDKLHYLRELRVAIPLHPLYHPTHSKYFKPED